MTDRDRRKDTDRPPPHSNISASSPASQSTIASETDQSSSQKLNSTQPVPGGNKQASKNSIPTSSTSTSNPMMAMPKMASVERSISRSKSDPTSSASSPSTQTLMGAKPSSVAVASDIAASDTNSSL